MFLRLRRVFGFDDRAMSLSFRGSSLLLFLWIGTGFDESRRLLADRFAASYPF